MAAITTAAIGVGTAAYGIYQGEQQKKKAKQAMNDYERAELNNVFDNIQLSTVGTDIAREETQRTASTAIDALQQGGSRNLLAGLPRVQSSINSQNQQIQKQLEEQDLRRSYVIAEDDARIRGVNEQRDAQNLQGIGSQYSAGVQQSHNGMLGAVAGIGSLSRAIRSNNSSIISEPNSFASDLSQPNVGGGEIMTYNVPNFGLDFMTKNLFNV